MQRNKAKYKIQYTGVKKFAVILACSFFVLTSFSTFAGNYLDELADEAEATASVSKRSQLSAKEQNEKRAMEKLLADEKPSTYKFYVKLKAKNKQYAYEQWATDKSSSDDRLHHLQKKVMDLYFSQ